MVPGGLVIGAQVSVIAKLYVTGLKYSSQAVTSTIRIAYLRYLVVEHDLVRPHRYTSLEDNVRVFLHSVLYGYQLGVEYLLLDTSLNTSCTRDRRGRKIVEIVKIVKYGRKEKKQISEDSVKLYT